MPSGQAPPAASSAGRYRTILDSLSVSDTASRRATLAYIAPFLVYVGFHGDRSRDSPAGALVLPARFLAVLVDFWIGVAARLKLSRCLPAASIGIGIAVFLIWIGPDLLFGYRHYWLFDNAITGHGCQFRGSRSETKCHVRRVAGGLLGGAVPVLEELFWRGWLSRWLIDQDFQKVPLGTYARAAFWIVAVLFASEHGPIGKSAWPPESYTTGGSSTRGTWRDCIAGARGDTNGLLSVYVLDGPVSGNYWL